MDLNCFYFKYAIVCRSVPNSITQGLSMSKHDEVNVGKAQEEQDLYLKCLESIGLRFIEIEGQEKYPDCVFVEDIAVAIKNKIFITNPGAASRRGEVCSVRNSLEKYFNENNISSFEIGSIKNINEAFIDGGDCCFTGRELLVGISKRTNKKGKFIFYIKFKFSIAYFVS